jgi:hypothetical protein
METKPEVRHSPAPALTDADVTARDKGAVSGLPEEGDGLGDPRPMSEADRSSEGSIRYRIAAMVAMLLLALVTLCIWYFGR